MTITEIQESIIEEFGILADDRESTIFYIMDLGQKIPAIKEEDRIDQNLIKGCQSKVWLTSEVRDGKVYFHADSNTDVTKGLISLLIRVFNDQDPEEIVNADLYFINRIGMNQMIGSQRSNGFALMIKQMKLFALAFGKLESKVTN